MKRMKFLSLSGAALLAATVAAHAAGPGGPALPAWSGTLAHFTITPRGAIDGVILADGTDAMFPPYLSTEIAYAAKLGDTVTIHGLKDAGKPAIRGISITDGTTGRTVTDRGPSGIAGRMIVDGKVAQDLYAPDGRKTGVLLTDGTALRLPPRAFDKPPVASLLKPGDHVAAVGFGTANALGRVVMARRIGPDFAHLTPVVLHHNGHHRGHGPMPRPTVKPMHGPGPVMTPASK